MCKIVRRVLFCCFRFVDMEVGKVSCLSCDRIETDVCAWISLLCTLMKDYSIVKKISSYDKIFSSLQFAWDIPLLLKFFKILFHRLQTLKNSWFHVLYERNQNSGVQCNCLTSGSGQTKRHQRHLATFFDPSIYWQGVCKHLVDNAPSVGILICSKNPVDARECFFQQRAKYLNLAGALSSVQVSKLKLPVHA